MIGGSDISVIFGIWCARRGGIAEQLELENKDTKW